MEKFMDFAKENFYYILGGFIIFIIILIAVASCSKGNTGRSYDKIEGKMVAAAKDYYSEHENKLPKNEEEVVSVSLAYLVENKYMKEVKDPKDKKQKCTGEVEVTRRGKNFNYQAFLGCGKNYKTEFLVEAVKKNTKLDDNGNGLYEENNEFVFKGEKLKNYVKFNNELWQVMKIDNEGDIKLVSFKPYKEEEYVWDDRYNVQVKSENGINDFKKSRIRETLNKVYSSHFNGTEGTKEKIVKKEFCIGTRKYSDDIKDTAECRDKISLYVGLITASEYHMASLDPKCTGFMQEQCGNYNYLNRENFYGWTLTGSTEESDTIFYYKNKMDKLYASNSFWIYPVIYIDSRTIISSGIGTKTNPYIVK